MLYEMTIAYTKVIRMYSDGNVLIRAIRRAVIGDIGKHFRYR